MLKEKQNIFGFAITSLRFTSHLGESIILNTEQNIPYFVMFI
jgi:hypothetical protein